MKLAASISIPIVLILAISFLDQHDARIFTSSWAQQEMAGHPSAGGSFASHELIDIQHCDDLITDVRTIVPGPYFLLTEVIPSRIPKLFFSQSVPLLATTGVPLLISPGFLFCRFCCRTPSSPYRYSRVL